MPKIPHVILNSGSKIDRNEVVEIRSTEGRFLGYLKLTGITAAEVEDSQGVFSHKMTFSHVGEPAAIGQRMARAAVKIIS